MVLSRRPAPSMQLSSAQPSSTQLNPAQPSSTQLNPDQLKPTELYARTSEVIKIRRSLTLQKGKLRLLFLQRFIAKKAKRSLLSVRVHSFPIDEYS